MVMQDSSSDWEPDSAQDGTTPADSSQHQLVGLFALKSSKARPGGLQATLHGRRTAGLRHGGTGSPSLSKTPENRNGNNALQQWNTSSSACTAGNFPVSLNDKLHVANDVSQLRALSETESVPADSDGAVTPSVVTVGHVAQLRQMFQNNYVEHSGSLPSTPPPRPTSSASKYCRGKWDQRSPSTDTLIKRGGVGRRSVKDSNAAELPNGHGSADSCRRPLLRSSLKGKHSHPGRGASSRVTATNSVSHKHGHAPGGATCSSTTPVKLLSSTPERLQSRLAVSHGQQLHQQQQQQQPPVHSIQRNETAPSGPSPVKPIENIYAVGNLHLTHGDAGIDSNSVTDHFPFGSNNDSQGGTVFHLSSSYPPSSPTSPCSPTWFCERRSSRAHLYELASTVRSSMGMTGFLSGVTDLIVPGAPSRPYGKNVARPDSVDLFAHKADEGLSLPSLGSGCRSPGYRSPGCLSPDYVVGTSAHPSPSHSCFDVTSRTALPGRLHYRCCTGSMPGCVTCADNEVLSPAEAQEHPHPGHGHPYTGTPVDACQVRRLSNPPPCNPPSVSWKASARTGSLGSVHPEQPRVHLAGQNNRKTSSLPPSPHMDERASTYASIEDTLASMRGALRDRRRGSSLYPGDLRSEPHRSEAPRVWRASEGDNHSPVNKAGSWESWFSRNGTDDSASVLSWKLSSGSDCSCHRQGSSGSPSRASVHHWTLNSSNGSHVCACASSGNTSETGSTQSYNSRRNSGHLLSHVATDGRETNFAFNFSPRLPMASHQQHHQDSNEQEQLKAQPDRQSDKLPKEKGWNIIKALRSKQKILPSLNSTSASSPESKSSPAPMKRNRWRAPLGTSSKKEETGEASSEDGHFDRDSPVVPMKYNFTQPGPSAAPSSNYRPVLPARGEARPGPPAVTPRRVGRSASTFNAYDNGCQNVSPSLSRVVSAGIEQYAVRQRHTGLVGSGPLPLPPRSVTSISSCCHGVDTLWSDLPTVVVDYRSNSLTSQ